MIFSMQPASNGEKSTRPESHVDVKPDRAELDASIAFSSGFSANFTSTSLNGTSNSVNYGNDILRRNSASTAQDAHSASMKEIVKAEQSFQIRDVQPVRDVSCKGYNVTCVLCGSEIMMSRQSNLLNHARRHANLKQFECIYCSYSHNEGSKVRLHMANNHKDFLSQPRDHRSPEMEKQWTLLMDKCFPEHVEVFKVKDKPALPSSDQLHDAIAKAKKDLSRNVLQSITETVHLLPSTQKAKKILHQPCSGCGELVAGDCMEKHIADRHSDFAASYKCEFCGFIAAKKWKVRIHFSVQHRITDCEPLAMQPGTRPDLFIPKFFPTYKDETKDDECPVDQQKSCDMKEVKKEELMNSVMEDGHLVIRCDVNVTGENDICLQEENTGTIRRKSQRIGVKRVRNED